MKKTIILVGAWIILLGCGLCFILTWDNTLNRTQAEVLAFGIVFIVPLIMWLVYAIIQRDEATEVHNWADVKNSELWAEIADEFYQTSAKGESILKLSDKFKIERK